MFGAVISLSIMKASVKVEKCEQQVQMEVRIRRELSGNI